MGVRRNARVGRDHSGTEAADESCYPKWGLKVPVVGAGGSGRAAVCAARGHGW
jgi:shikimate 5-dehydrogenase